jgi:hypothetical protein
MRERFLAHHKARADPDTTCAKHKGCGNLASGCDTPCRQHRGGGNDLKDRWNQDERRQAPVVVASRFAPLGDDQVNARLNGLLGGFD